MGKAEGLHVTLKFFGEIEENKVQEIEEALTGINKQHEAIAAQLKEINAFPDLIRPRVIVVTFQEGVDNVKAIFHDIESRLASWKPMTASTTGRGGGDSLEDKRKPRKRRVSGRRSSPYNPW